MDGPEDPPQASMDKPEQTVHGLTNGPERAAHVSMDGLSGLIYLFSESTIHMDPNGDLDLVIGLDKDLRTFRVSSAMMRQASPVWRAMLTNGLKESFSGSGPVNFPEDNVLSFFVVLLATHLRFPEIPRQIDSTHFKDICVLCDKYDCMAVVQPLLDNWKMELSFGDTRIYTPEEYKSWAWIGWTTGDERVIRRVKKHYILRSRTNAAKKLLDEDNKTLDGDLPPGLIEIIHEARRQALTHFVKGCAEMVNHWGDTSSRARCTVARQHQQQCDALYFGHLVQTVRKWKLWPGQTHRLVSGLEARSIRDTSASLKRVQAPVYQQYNGLLNSRGEHQYCGWTKELYSLIDCDLDAKAHEAIEASVPHLKAQLQQLQPKTIPVSRFQTSAASRKS